MREKKKEERKQTGIIWLRKDSGNGSIEVLVLVLVVLMVLALLMEVFPLYLAKQKVDLFATEVLRVAEIAGGVGVETDAEIKRLEEELGIRPEVSWSVGGRVNLNQPIQVTVLYEQTLGLFGSEVGVSIQLRGEARGSSEVYWK